jgi:glyoxylate reductase
MRPIPQAGLDRLRPDCRVLEVLDAAVLADRPALCAALRGRDAIICDVGVPIDRELLAAAAPTCRVLANFGVGTDHIDLLAAREFGMVVTSTPGVLTEATADLTWALILAVARRVLEADRLVRSGEWTGWAPLQPLGVDLSGKTLGIVGAGRIGTAVARRATGFQMRVSYVNRSSNDTVERMGGRRVDLHTCLAESDFLSLHLPLSPQTRHLIGAEQLRRMRPTAYLINTSRGPVVDERALVAALQVGVIAGAGLDVYEHEPYPTPELLTMSNVVCLPHVGSATVETRDRMAIMTAENVLAVLSGAPPPNPVLAHVGEASR